MLFSGTEKQQHEAIAYLAIKDKLPREPAVSFDDPRVQTVYSVICGDNAPPPGEHWDGYVSRLIVDALFKTESSGLALAGHCAALLTSDGAVFTRSKVTDHHQAELTAKQWQTEYMTSAIIPMYEGVPEIV